jgi:O-antigen ligase
LWEKFGVFTQAQGNIHEMTHGRTLNWIAIFKLLLDNPLAIISGIGWGTYFSNIRTGAAHNEFLLLFLQLGAIGFTLFLLFLFSYFKILYRFAGKKEDLFYKCLVCSLFVLFANAMFGVVEMTFYAYTLGIGISYILLDDDGARKKEGGYLPKSDTAGFEMPKTATRSMIA